MLSWAVLVVFLLSAGMVVLAGWELTRRAEELAERTGLGQAWIGAILLAAATSLPELSVDLTAVRVGEANFAIGDLFGSCMVNMLILALADFLTPQVRILTRVVVEQALAGALAVVLLALAAVGIITGSTPTIFGFGWTTLVIAAVYVWGAWVLHVTQRATVLPRPVPDYSHARGDIRWLSLRFCFAVVILVFAAIFLIRSAESLVGMLGISAGFFGIVALAVVTSLPEAVVSLAGARSGSYDLVVGNLLGSNAFNMVVFVVLDAVDGPGALLGQADLSALVGNLFAIVLTALVVLGTLSRAEARIPVLDPVALAIVVFYVLGIVLSYGIMA